MKYDYIELTLGKTFFCAQKKIFLRTGAKTLLR